MATNRARRSLRCRLNLHSWELKAGEAGRYHVCKRCGKEKFQAPLTRGDSIG